MTCIFWKHCPERIPPMDLTALFIKKAVTAAAFLLMLLFGFCAMDPVLASKIPLLGDVFSHIQDQVDVTGSYSDYAQTVGQAVTDSGISVTVSEIYCDGISVYASFVIESRKAFDPDGSADYSIHQLALDCETCFTDETEKRKLNGVSPAGLEGEFTNPHTFIGMGTYPLSDGAFPESFDFCLKITSIGLPGKPGNLYQYMVSGNWEFRIPVIVDPRDVQTCDIYEEQEGHSIDQVISSPIMITVYTSYPDIYEDTLAYRVYVFGDLSDENIGYSGEYGATRGITRIARATLDVSLFVTGSNSTLLSGEPATLLTGRTVEFEILPFSFYEMKQYYEINRMEWSEEMFSDYLKWGGFPLRFDYKDETSVHRYLSNLYKSIVNRDITGKSRSADKKSFMDISLYILANAGKEFSIDNIIAAYRKENREISRRTVYHYLERMKKAYLIHGVGRYNITGKSALRNREKQYAVDVGFRTINTNTIHYEDTFFLENIIYNELITRGYTVFAGKTYKGEIDFVAVKDGRKCFIQVAYLLASEAAIKREFGAYRTITDASPKYVMSLDKIDLSHDGIVHMNILDFLLRRADLMLT